MVYVLKEGKLYVLSRTYILLIDLHRGSTLIKKDSRRFILLSVSVRINFKNITAHGSTLIKNLFNWNSFLNWNVWVSVDLCLCVKVVFYSRPTILACHNRSLIIAIIGPLLLPLRVGLVGRIRMKLIQNCLYEKEIIFELFEELFLFIL